MAFESRRRIGTVLAIALAVMIGYHVISGQNGLSVYQEKRAEDRSLRVEIDQLQQENSRLKDHVGRLQNDPDAIEHEARERLHYTRQGEVIYTLDQPMTDAVAKPSKDARQALDPAKK